MIDSCLLLVDAAEGPLPQTKFVLTKALALNLRPIVIINKIDRPDARVSEVLDEVFNLFLSLNASDEQLDFPILYASGREGWAVKNLNDERIDLKPLFKTIDEHVPEPQVDKSAPFSMLATLLSSDPYLGRVLIGKVYSGIGEINMPIKVLNLKGGTLETGRLVKLFGFHGIKRIPRERVEAGDIIAVAGLKNASVADTICAVDVTVPIKSIPVDPPTMSITMGANTSPFAGTEGSKVTSRGIGERLYKEAESNVAITVKPSADGDLYEVGGRGELQLGVLIENMRREGFELSVLKPRVLFRTDPDSGEKLEPIEEVVIDVDDQYSGTVVEKLSARKGELVEMRPSGGAKTRIIFHIPTRTLLGYQREFFTDTSGTGVLNRIFHAYKPYRGTAKGRTNGMLISMATGVATAYALWNVEERGYLFISPQDKVYEGMIIGVHSRENDLAVNPIREKQLTNVRSVMKDEAVRLTPPKKLTIEDAISFIEDDEMLEVTPTSIRMRKKYLNENERKRHAKK
jgi:GTP-binding protein